MFYLFKLTLIPNLSYFYRTMHSEHPKYLLDFAYTAHEIVRAKEKYRGMFETQKSGNKTSSGDIGLDIRTHASPKVGQDQVSVGESVLCWQLGMPHPLHMFYRHLIYLGKKSNSVIRSRSVTVKNWCNVPSMEGVTVCGHHPECVTFGRG